MKHVMGRRNIYTHAFITEKSDLKETGSVQEEGIFINNYPKIIREMRTY